MVKKFEDAKARFDGIQEMAKSKGFVPMEVSETCRNFRDMNVD